MFIDGTMLTPLNLIKYLGYLIAVELLLSTNFIKLANVNIIINRDSISIY